MIRAAVTALTILIALPAGSQTVVPRTQAEISLGFAPLVKQAAPAVVNIYAKIITQGRSSPFGGDPFFEEFFRGFSAPRPRVQNSLGSGVILSSGGLVDSNYHVVAPGAYGARIGLQPRDVILTINKQQISRSDDVRAALTDPGRHLRMDLMRRGQRVSLRARL